VKHATFEDWWEPFTLGVGPAGMYLMSLDTASQTELRERCRNASDPVRLRSIPEPGARGDISDRGLSAARASVSRADARRSDEGGTSTWD
jgi:hypothetical protein